MSISGLDLSRCASSANRRSTFGYKALGRKRHHAEEPTRLHSHGECNSIGQRKSTSVPILFPSAPERSRDGEERESEAKKQGVQFSQCLQNYIPTDKILSILFPASTKKKPSLRLTNTSSPARDSDDFASLIAPHAPCAQRYAFPQHLPLGRSTASITSAPYDRP